MTETEGTLGPLQLAVGVWGLFRGLLTSHLSPSFCSLHVHGAHGEVSGLGWGGPEMPCPSSHRPRRIPPAHLSTPRPHTAGPWAGATASEPTEWVTAHGRRGTHRGRAWIPPTLCLSSVLAACRHAGCQMEEPGDRVQEEALSVPSRDAGGLAEGRKQGAGGPHVDTCSPAHPLCRAGRWAWGTQTAACPWGSQPSTTGGVPP